MYRAIRLQAVGGTRARRSTQVGRAGSHDTLPSKLVSMTALRRYFAAVVSPLLCAAVVLASWPFDAGYVRTGDRNHDGRPDQWDVYDARGDLRRTLSDANFDGHSDWEESYEGGCIAQRISDRNFDHRLDVVEEFDPNTCEHTRSVVDVDFDGRADLLVLFEAGRVVLARWAPQPGTPDRDIDVAAKVDAAAPPAAGGLARFLDPFRGDLSLSTPRDRGEVRLAATLPCGALPVDGIRACPPSQPAARSAFTTGPLDSAPRPTRLTRGPPAPASL